MTFDGDAFDPDELELLYSAPFFERYDDRRRTLRHLAIGASAARNLRLQRFTVEVAGSRPYGISLIGDEVTELDVELREKVPWTTRISLKKSLGLDTVLRFFDTTKDERKEEELLKEWCRFSRSNILVNGVKVSNGFTLGAGIRNIVDIEAEGIEGRLGIARDGKAMRVHLLQHGVLLQTRTIPASHGRITAHADIWAGEVVIDSSRLTTNLAQSTLVEDEVWEEIETLIKEATFRSISKSLEEVEHWDDLAHSQFFGSLSNFVRNVDPRDLQVAGAKTCLRKLRTLLSDPAHADRIWAKGDLSKLLEGVIEASHS